jgi:uncharacterized Zn-binding protein involved in type VI secretion
MLPVARIGDTVRVEHPNCQPITTCLTGSFNVFINGLAAHRLGDLNATHLIRVGRSCIPHQTALVTGSTSVFVNGLPLGKVGSVYPCGAKVITGSFNVFVGN